MDLTIKLDKPAISFPLTVPLSTTVDNLKLQISLNMPSKAPPQSIRIIHSGILLKEPDLVLAAIGIADGATVCASQKKKCHAASCTNSPAIIGQCTYCGGKYCNKHRLLEDHACAGLQDCKRESHNRNAAKLNSESCIASKIAS
ncbi:AN1-type zinc finger protein TMC1 [Neolecta irregularis DAH-3]|uniref:AN1-type zinc finger protein TMC1 n=1 Tax=Neolecta irregularis (strain DAH-3) TaxID=1198029 RepID=A0A1U7LK61_NEOID|nr:AN1-type zinc finger protein TMC1 [Neolecta irregularis DAH-3]|eukprot:OLL23034.1 AN1-type zinc finger protein TMC1 [Neolecta irregularis DAH-3]